VTFGAEKVCMSSIRENYGGVSECMGFGLKEPHYISNLFRKCGERELDG